MLGMVIGVIRLEDDIQTKGFFIMTYLFSIFAAFTLAKVIRDKDEDKKSSCLCKSIKMLYLRLLWCYCLSA